MLDFGFLKAYMLESFIRTAQPDAQARLHLDGLMREATSYTLCERPARRLGGSACEKSQTVQSAPPTIKQP